MRRSAGILLSYVDLLLVIVAILIVSVAPKKIAEGVVVKAEYLVSIEWAKELDDDVDLWGVGPPDYSKPTFYKNTEQGALNLDRDSRGFMDDRIKIDGKYVFLPHHETMTLRGIIPGRYDFAIQLYKARYVDTPREPHHLGIVVHVEVVRLNPKVTTIFRKDFALQFEGDAINIWSMNVLPDGGFIEVDPPIEPISNRFYRIESELGSAHAPQVP